MNIKEHIEKNALNYIGLFLTSIVAFLISSYLIVKNKTKEINENWEENRCKPTVIPFVSLIRTFKEGNVKGTLNNFNKCLYTISKHILDELMQPLHSLMETLHKTTSALSDGISNMRKFFSTIKSLLMNVILNISLRIENTLEVLHKMFIKNMELLKKQKGITQIITYVLISIAYTVFSLFNSVGRVIKIFIEVLISMGWLVLFFCCSPILAVLGVWASGVGLSWVCFDEDTEITMANGEKKKISLIKNGEYTKHGGKVTGTFKFSSKDVEMYKYNNVIVSGNHSVYDNKKWKKIEDCDSAIKLNNWNKPYIWCLSTENNILYINDTIFSDYYEVSDSELIHKVRNSQLKEINKHSKSKDITSDNYGFAYNTKVQLKDNTYKQINKLKIGDILKKNGKVLGVIKLNKNKDTNMYKKYGSDNLIVEGTTFVHNKEGWDCVYNSDGFETVKTKYIYIYNILTENGKINIGDNEFTDYNELSKDYGTETIDKTYLDYMNYNINQKLSDY